MRKILFKKAWINRIFLIIEADLRDKGDIYDIRYAIIFAYYGFQHISKFSIWTSIYLFFQYSLRNIYISIFKF